MPAAFTVSNIALANMAGYKISLVCVEMYLLLAALVQNFDFSTEGATVEDFELKRDSLAIGTEAECNLVVHVDPYKKSRCYLI